MKKPANEFEDMVDLLAQDIIETVDSMEEQPKPFGAVKLNRAEQLQRYYAVRESVPAWQALIQEHGIKDVLDYAREMERLHNAGG